MSRYGNRSRDIIYCREINTIWNDILYRKIENAVHFPIKEYASPSRDIASRSIK